jgi:hypothetical protein
MDSAISIKRLITSAAVAPGLGKHQSGNTRMINQVKVNPLSDFSQDMLFTGTFFVVETGKKELVVIRWLVTHYDKNSCKVFAKRKMNCPAAELRGIKKDFFNHDAEHR